MAASWLEEYKKIQKKTTKGTTGLRKSISGSVDQANYVYLIYFVNLNCVTS